MREPGAVSCVVGWGVLVGFGAGSGPPTRGVFLNFAHFGTAAVCVGFGARAVADRRRGALQRAWSVRQYWPAPGRQSHDAVQRHECQSATQSRHPSRAERGAIHGQSLRASGKKTDRTERQKIGITRVLGPGEWWEHRGGFPTRTGAVSQIGISRCTESVRKPWTFGQMLDINTLM